MVLLFFSFLKIYKLLLALSFRVILLSSDQLCLACLECYLAKIWSKLWIWQSTSMDIMSKNPIDCGGCFIDQLPEIKWPPWDKHLWFNWKVEGDTAVSSKCARVILSKSPARTQRSCAGRLVLLSTWHKVELSEKRKLSWKNAISLL